jgi:Uma2 family endonuclease
MSRARPATIPLTYEEYAAMPQDGRRLELIDGDFEMNPAPSTRHQTVSRRLQYELMSAIEEQGLGQVFDAPLDLILSGTNVVQPDLCIVSTANEHLISARGIEGPPDVVVEILSPSTSTLDRRVKRALYARFGIGEYWLVDPELGHLELYQIAEDSYHLEQRFDRASVLETRSFPSVHINLARVFRR